MRLSNFRNRYWKPALKRAGMDPSFRIHDQRHTAISLWIKAGINPKDVSVHAGHTSVAFTLDKYGHLYPDNGDAFLLALDASTDKWLFGFWRGDAPPRVPQELNKGAPSLRCDSANRKHLCPSSP